MDILITNNPLVAAQCRGDFKIEYTDADLQGILIRVRDLVHIGHRLLTHPLMGSVKPNESPYKSILISGAPGKLDTESVNIIEQCIQTTQKFAKKDIPEQYLSDLQIVDLSLIRTVQSVK